MALWDEVAGRYPATTLVQLTNAGASTSATTVDSTRAGYAVTDVTAAFKTIGGLTYDNSNSQHVDVAVEAVVARLRLFGEFQSEEARTEWGRALDRIRELSRYSHRAKTQPKTNSRLTPSTLDSTQTQRPAFDQRQLEHVIPKAPREQTLTPEP